MPLLHRRPFQKIPPPKDLDPDEEVFHCTLTNEIFRHYDDFYERTILCNSLVWSCAITERPNLTYQEALDSEKAARKKLSKVSPSILRPLMYLVGLSRCSRVDDLNEEVYVFMKERYFIGETVEVQTQKKKMKQSGQISQVICSSQSSVNGHVRGEDDGDTSSGTSSEDEDDVPLSSSEKNDDTTAQLHAERVFNSLWQYNQICTPSIIWRFKPPKPTEASEVRYIVKLNNGTDAHVRGVSIRRKQGIYNRQISKLYIKANCIKPQGLVTEPYVVKDEVKKKLGLNELKWEEIFAGAQPNFISAKIQKAKKETAANDKEEKLRLDKLREKEKEELRQAREIEREEKRKTKEEERKRKAEENEKLREAARLDKERKKKEREEEMLKLKEEREYMKHQKQEEKRRLAEYLKEWGRPRDDLECDDLQELPQPYELCSVLPPALFGDILSLLEFLNNFGDLFDAADEFPDGVSLSLLIEAVTEHKHDGPLCDLLFFFLSNLFRSQSEEEEGSEHIQIESSDPELASQFGETSNEESLQAFATLTSLWSILYQGYPLQKLELDSYTVSEILRLYLLTSASRPRGEDRLWRFQQRGGYSIMDDTPSNLCMRHPEIIHKLSRVNVFDLEAGEKLQILTCLSHHLLTFVVPRDRLDESWEKLQQAQLSYRDDKAAEKRREKEFALEKSKFKCEQMNLEKRARMNKIEENLKRNEATNQDMEVDVEEVTEKAKEEDQPKLLNPLERAQRLQLFEEDELQAKEAWSYRKHNHVITIAKYQSAFRVCSLGEDRFYRRYWMLTSIPGVFVEEYPDPDLTEDMLRVQVPQKAQSTLSTSGYSTPGVSDSSAVGTPVRGGPAPINPVNGVVIPMSALPTINIIPPDGRPPEGSPLLRNVLSTSLTSLNGQSLPLEERLPVEPFTQGKQYKWGIYRNIDEIEALISALNTRGYRESKLHSKLIANKDVILTKLNNRKRPISKLLALPEPSNPAVKCEKQMELLLRDQILDLEDKLWAGTLGITKLSNRHSWRECLQTGEDYEGTIIQDTSPPVILEEEEEGRAVVCDPSVKLPALHSSGSNGLVAIEDNDERTKIVKDLSNALLIVERAVDRKYLKQPLGCAVDTRKGFRGRAANENVDEAQRKKANLLLRRWETSLLSATSLSQIFLHLSTLERSITWSRSILNAKCRICRRKGDGEKMLLCDKCDRGHHMYCLRPAIKTVPSGNWYCPDCKPRSAKISPRKVVRTKSFAQDESSESEASESEAEVESIDEESLDEEPPVKKKLTYRVTNKTKKTNVREVKKRSRRSDTGKVDIGASKRRTATVWKDLSACEEILSELIKHRDSGPFVDPVSKKLVPDYYTIIKKPMDLGKILRKLKNVQYTSPADFIDDVDLIFQNCHVYNDPRSNIAKTASSLKAFFDSKLEARNLINYRVVMPGSKAKKRRTT